MIGEKYSQLGTRADWQSHEGFLYVGDVALKMMGELATATPVILPESCDITPSGISYNLANQYPANASLFLAANDFSNHIPRLGNAGVADRWRFGMTRKDWKGAESHQTFGHGVAEINFTWHFAPAIASTVAHTFVKEGKLSGQDLDNFTLSDWANIIGTGWFSRLMHAMAYTRNAMYRQYGRHLRDFFPSGFRQYLIEESNVSPDTLAEAGDFFVVSDRYEPEEDMTYTTASLSPGMRKFLRKSIELNPEVTGGCPVARYGTTILRAAAAKNRHVERMVAREQLEVVENRSTDDTVRLRLDWSPIDVSLAVLAQNLDAYDTAYGTPVLNFVRPRPGETVAKISHKRAEPVDVLRRKAA